MNLNSIGKYRYDNYSTYSNELNENELFSENSLETNEQDEIFSTKNYFADLIEVLNDPKKFLNILEEGKVDTEKLFDLSKRFNLFKNNYNIFKVRAYYKIAMMYNLLKKNQANVLGLQDEFIKKIHSIIENRKVENEIEKNDKLIHENWFSFVIINWINLSTGSDFQNLKNEKTPNKFYEYFNDFMDCLNEAQVTAPENESEFREFVWDDPIIVDFLYFNNYQILEFSRCRIF